MRALVIGRFQPFHLGHLSVVQEVAPEVDEVIVGIAAANDSFKPDHPFTAGERNEMITRALAAAGVGAFRVVNIPDIHNYAAWAKYVVSQCPPFDLVVAHNPTTLELFRELGYQVRRARPYRRDTHSGTRIRELMAEGGPWRELVPEQVASFIDSMDGEGRVRRLLDRQ